ncbi:MAG: hypothetical protein ACI33K_13585 [Clostridiaceae bacterium]
MSHRAAEGAALWLFFGGKRAYCVISEGEIYIPGDTMGTDSYSTDLEML